MTNVPWRECIHCHTAFIPERYERVCHSCLSRCSECSCPLAIDSSAPRRVRKCDNCRRRYMPLSRLKHADPQAYELELARLRHKNNMRTRVATRFTDISRTDEMRLRASATECAICHCVLHDVRHVDHIVPIELGGTHTKDNLRVTCPSCNLTRPRDYSDIGAFQMNLWMGTDAAAERVAVHANKTARNNRTCTGCGSHNSVPDQRAWRGEMVCYACKPKNSRAKGDHRARKPKMSYDGKHDMRKVVELRRSGAGYKRIASAIGTSRGTARELVKRAIAIGLVEA